MNIFKTTNVFNEIRVRIQKKGHIYKELAIWNLIVTAVLEVPDSVKKQNCYAMFTLMQKVQELK